MHKFRIKGISISTFSLLIFMNLYVFSNISPANKKIFVKRQRMLNRVGVKSGTLSLKIFAELALVLEIFFRLFFYNFA